MASIMKVDVMYDIIAVMKRNERLNTGPKKPNCYG